MIRDWIAAHRRSLTDTLDGLSEAEWDAPTLCTGWAVRHVVAHLTMPFRYSVPRFLFEMVKAGGSFQRMSDGIAGRDADLPRAHLVAAVRDNAHHPWKPPGGGYEGALTHDVIHAFDITEALEVDHRIPAEPMRAVLQTVTGARSRGHFGAAVDGLELQASDLNWSWGSGVPLLGRARDLSLLLTGRPVSPEAFSGAGAGQLTGGARR